MFVGETIKGIELLERVVYVEATTLQPDDPSRLCTLHNLVKVYIDIEEVTKRIKM